MGEREIDRELVNQVRLGDKEAFSLLVIKYQSKISGVLRRYIDNKSHVSDVVQEAFMNAYRALDKFEERSSFYTWLYRIAVNTAKNFTKTNGRRPPDSDIDVESVGGYPDSHFISDFPSPDSVLHCEELKQAVFTVLHELPVELRISIVLREMAGLSYEEISALTNVPIGTVRSRIFRARSLVDEQIKPMRHYDR
jgi:RNA polymerase sigma-70 factor (ECF subfamily)